MSQKEQLDVASLISAQLESITLAICQLEGSLDLLNKQFNLFLQAEFYARSEDHFAQYRDAFDLEPNPAAKKARYNRGANYYAEAIGAARNLSQEVYGLSLGEDYESKAETPEGE